ncbi:MULTISPECIES: hypothetical protein [Methylomicrobium]|uniref:Integral membrane protein n=1 Tax=Methylomicrobium album BG8 TaxID=686340 RepID=H8GKQ0_METAL|nr:MULTISPECIES: hypothetical protein [Methylomicrobium]EIC28058.1 hypothetical protein Metal_0191 [Methylomicrobium album BG8]
MTTLKKKILKNPPITLAILSVTLLPLNAGANDGLGTGAVLYTTPAYGPAIHSYPGSTVEKKSPRPEIVYVSLAYGPAIYGYPHAGREKTVPWNVEYVDPAYGPAIYSYDRIRVQDKASVFSLLFD